jgi:2-iminobutanoate/2-iminopropanoate deaminase
MIAGVRRGQQGPAARPERARYGARMSRDRRVVEAAVAPGALGPYSHGIVAGGLLFCSGQLGVDPETGSLVRGGAAEEATACLRNLAEVCRAAGARLEDAVRLTVYLTDLAGDGPAVNDAYASFFSAVASALPARAAVGVASLPLGARVEIDAIVAVRGGGPGGGGGPGDHSY